MKILNESYLQRFSDWEAGRKSVGIKSENTSFLSCWGVYDDDRLFYTTSTDGQLRVSHITEIKRSNTTFFVIHFANGDISDPHTDMLLESKLKLYKQVAII